MLLDDFDYHLPPELIAQQPVARRGESRLLTLDRATAEIAERRFGEIAEALCPGDLLVVNDTRVIPARIFGTKETGGRVEIFLVRRSSDPDEIWSCLIRASKPPRPGSSIVLPDGVIASVIDRRDGELWTVRFDPADNFTEWLDLHGEIPLPPYIRRNAAEDDRDRYQTVFARERGAVAAPTAGLHMTPDLLETIRGQGVSVAPLTLHVGIGTFQPVRVEDVRSHRMHREVYSIPASTAEMIERTRSAGGRVVALGTTTTRALEYASIDGGRVRAGSGEADIFIYPGYRFRVVDALVTNFHLPKSTLLMLVSAFAGRELLFRAYGEAIRRGFRFYSYGDAMFIT